jgi:hypothetical protein
LKRVRLIDGFADFLRTPSFRTLQAAGDDGPVIFVNVSKARCDALIIRGNEPLHLVPLPSSSPCHFNELACKLSRAIAASNAKAKHEGLLCILRELWGTVVNPVVHKLLALGIYKKSRIWWCLTGPLCALPIHAAGPFRPGERNLPDIFVSSYTPNLMALITARAAAASSSDTIPKLLVIGQSTTLPMVKEEVHQIKQMGGFVDVLLDSEATVGTVISNLRTHSWTHFACHGSLKQDEPFSSAFKLDCGDSVTVLDIARARLPHADFAFLSVCHTAAPDISTPEEFITLAAALQFAGFRGVVSTLWKMEDQDGPDVARDFYGYMFHGNDTANSTRAAIALNEVARLMRKNKVPLDRWVNFIHIGL